MMYDSVWNGYENVKSRWFKVASSTVYMKTHSLVTNHIFPYPLAIIMIGPRRHRNLTKLWLLTRIEPFFPGQRLSFSYIDL